ncbi:MAG TPA: questin oxidase family protein [Rhizobium sp.]
MEACAQSDSQSTLRALLFDLRNSGSEFAGTFANHAPMVLVAQQRMGASGDQLRRFLAHYDAYKGLLPFKDSAIGIDAGNWSHFLGQREHEGAYRRFFAAERSAMGLAGLLRHWLPKLAPGLGSSAFHALMRTAYALLNDDEDEVVLSLAYWCACWLDMPARTNAPSISSDPSAILVYAGSLPTAKGQPVHDLIWQNMRQSFALPGFETASDWLAIDNSALERCASAAIALFAATQDFCALHAVTGLHWIRVLQPWHDATDEMVRYFWAGIAALMNEMQFPVPPSAEALERWRTLPCPDWPDIFAAACQSFDEHDLSLTFSCAQEEETYHEPLYRRAAARRLGMIPEMKA